MFYVNYISTKVEKHFLNKNKKSSLLKKLPECDGEARGLDTKGNEGSFAAIKKFYIFILVVGTQLYILSKLTKLYT